MAKLYFYYSAMNAGKSSVLLQSAYNYKERGMETLLFTPAFDTRFAEGKITSRIGLSADAIAFDRDFNLFLHTKNYKLHHPNLACVFVDEVHFLIKEHVTQLAAIVDELDIPVLTYGLRSDFRGEPFESTKYLLILADNLVEIKTICHCGRKATMTVLFDATNKVVKDGAQFQLGGNERYISMCRKHFNEAHEKMMVLA